MKTNSQTSTTEETEIGVLGCRAYLTSIKCVTRNLQSLITLRLGLQLLGRIIATNMTFGEVGGNALCGRTLRANRMVINKVLEIVVFLPLSFFARHSQNVAEYCCLDPSKATPQDS